MKTRLLVFIKTLINHCCLLSTNALIATLKRHIPYIDIEVKGDGINELYLFFHFDSCPLVYKLIIEKRGDNAFYIKEITE